ncbi:MAG TPA: glycosyl hydrolase family 31, partial [Bacteroidales bacterium]|nr:glycosyl hydrolase family 31 [Bacteroidales bacterium]
MALIIAPIFTKANIKVKDNGDGISLQVEGGVITLKPLNDNSIRVKIQKSEEVIEIEELIYTVKLPRIDYLIKEDANSIILDLENIKAIYNKNKKTLSFKDRLGNIVLEEKEGGRLLQPDVIKDFNVYRVGQKFISPSDEYIYGTGQFQDGHLNIRGLSRRLTQVNSQISIPFILS